MVIIEIDGLSLFDFKRVMAISDDIYQRGHNRSIGYLEFADRIDSKDIKVEIVLALFDYKSFKFSVVTNSTKTQLETVVLN